MLAAFTIAQLAVTQPGKKGRQFLSVGGNFCSVLALLNRAM